MPQRTYDRLKNFSTTIAVEKTVMEIERMLAKFGAMKTVKEFDGKGEIVGLGFSVDTPNGEMPIKLPAKIERIEEVFRVQVSEGLIPKKYHGSDWAREQAARTAWRIIKDWVDAQLALIKIDMVKIEEVFLPYIYSARFDRTIFQAFESKELDLDRMLSEGQPKEVVIDGNQIYDISPKEIRKDDHLP